MTIGEIEKRLTEAFPGRVMKLVVSVWSVGKPNIRIWCQERDIAIDDCATIKDAISQMRDRLREPANIRNVEITA